jgi:hypothetical protein
MNEAWLPLSAEINLIKNPSIVAFVQFALESAPAYFWTVPASTSGKYHPTKCRAPGGLVHHTRMVVYFVSHMMLSMHCEAWHDELIAAAILHDMYKNGDNPKKFMGQNHWAAHGMHLAGHLQRQAGWAHWAGNASVNKILDLTARHMQHWGGAAPRPASMEDWCLALADYVSSRKLVNIEQFDESKIP